MSVGEEKPTGGVNVEGNIFKVDLGKASAFGTKLIETFEKGTTALLAPWQVRRLAHAEADAKKIHAVADAEIAAFDALPEQTRELQMRALNRLLVQGTTRQQNIEAIISEAPNYAPEIVSSDPVDPDWKAAFIDSCQDVSDAQLRTLWSKMLATEVARPNSISRRVLTSVRQMGKSDAVAFETLCGHSLFGHVFGMDERPERFVFSFSKAKLGRDAFESLALLGLIAHEDINQGFRGTQVADLTFFGSEVEFYKTANVQGGHEGAVASVQQTICCFTVIGRELLTSLQLKKPASLPIPLVDHFERVYRIALRYRYG